MIYRIFLILYLSLFLIGCNQTTNYSSNKIEAGAVNKYKNLGFALIYNDSLLEIKQLEPRSLNIYHKSLKKRSIVKITNPENDKYLLFTGFTILTTDFFFNDL